MTAPWRPVEKLKSSQVSFGTARHAETKKSHWWDWFTRKRKVTACQLWICQKPV